MNLTQNEFSQSFSFSYVPISARKLLYNNVTTTASGSRLWRVSSVQVKTFPRRETSITCISIAHSNQSDKYTLELKTRKRSLFHPPPNNSNNKNVISRFTGSCDRCPQVRDTSHAVDPVHSHVLFCECPPFFFSFSLCLSVCVIRRAVPNDVKRNANSVLMDLDGSVSGQGLFFLSPSSSSRDALHNS
jgi:hypothetical protein